MAAKARPYKNYLSPFLHRQFGYVMGLTLVLCYVESLWIGQWDSLFWVWFSAGVRALLLFISFLFVLCLCMAHSHTGERTSHSELQTLGQYLYSISALSSFICYGASAFFYGIVYIWSQPAKSNLGFVDQGKPYERSKLNERPIYLYVMFLQLAAVQAVIHIYRDYGRVRIPFMSPSSMDGPTSPPSRRLALKKSLLPMVHDTLSRVGLFIIGGNATYFLFFRKLAWRVAYPLALVLDRTIPGARPRPGFNPFELSGRVAIEGIMLVFLWEFANTAMTIYLSKEPVKRDKEHKLQPITSDSKDPNGSLLLGLRAKKDLLRAFAFWELAIIAQRFEDRRKTIYTELDRPTFKEILDACLVEIIAVKGRIESVSAPPAPPPPTELELAQQRLKAGYSKPLIAEPLKEDDVFAPSAAPAGLAAQNFRLAKNFAREHGKSPGPHPFAPFVNEELPRLIGNTAQKLPPASAVQAWCQQLLRSPFLGNPFRQTFARRSAAAMLGVPRSHASTAVNAITALTQLTLRSIKEDVYGVVNRDIVLIIRAYASVLASVEAFVKRDLDVHWTDVGFVEGESRRYKNLGEVGEVAKALKEGLTAVLRQFEIYLRGMEMSERELREAKELLAGVNVE